MADVVHGDFEPSSRRFQLRSRLGEGGMGAVYEAVDLKRGTRVALKELHQCEPEAVQRFKAEFRNLQDLHHPNLVSLGELVEEEGRWFFTMELVQGQDFLSYVRQGESPPVLEATQALSDARSTMSLLGSEESTQRLPQAADTGSAPAPGSLTTVAPSPSAKGLSPDSEQRLRQALRALALGLHALHRVGKVHRDIKPSNILVTEFGRVVLLDFGILSNVGEDEVWEPSLVVGTAAYMAPEQARGEPITPQADWYSVGVLLYQSLTGCRPFSGSPREVLEAKQNMDPTAPQELVPGLAEDLCQLCMELLRRDPRARPGDEQVLQRLGLEQAAREEAWATALLPFVGRDSELALLHQALRDSRSGASVSVRVEGESGVGKTRLVKRFLEQLSAQAPDTVVLSGRCYERESVPYKGVDGIVDSLARYLLGPGRHEAPGLLPPGAGALAHLFPTLQRLEGLGNPQPFSGEALQLRVAAFTALRELFARLTALHPVVLSVDDLQWADRDSAMLLDEVLRAPGLLLVATVRVATEVEETLNVLEYPFWGQARTLALERLPTLESQALVEQLLGQESAELSQAQRIAQESGGHPLFIDALVRYQRLGGSEQRPLKLEEALWARIERLEPLSRLLLKLLTVAEAPLHHQVLTEAAGVELTDYGPLVASLRGARLALSTGLAGSDTLEVVHDKVRRAVLPHLPEHERRGLHLRLASALEALSHGQPERLAYHWLEAGHTERAVHYELQAARQAAQVLAFDREARHYRKALALGTWSEPERRRLQTALAEALGRSGHGQEAAQLFLSAAQGAPAGEARGLERRAMDQYLMCGCTAEGVAVARRVLASIGMRYPETMGRALSSLLWQQILKKVRPSRFRLSEPEQVPAEVQERLEVLHALSFGLGPLDPLRAYCFQARHVRLAFESGEPRHLCRALCSEVTSSLLWGPGKRRHAERQIALIEQVLERLPQEHGLRGFALASRAWMACFLGEFHHASEPFEQAVALLQRAKESWWDLSTTWLLGAWLLSEEGRMGELHQRLSPLLVEARERQDLFRMATLQLGNAALARLAATNDAQGTLAVMDELISHMSRDAYRLQHYYYLRARIGVAAYQGQYGEVLRLLAEDWPVLKRSFFLKMPTLSRPLLATRAIALLAQAQQQPSQARELLRAAQADARQLEKLGMPPTVALADLVRASMAMVSGAPEAAELYAQAARRLEETGMLLAAAVARLRQGELLGGEGGRELAESSRQWMRQRGILCPEAMALTIVPPLPTRAAPRVLPAP